MFGNTAIEGWLDTWRYLCCCHRVCCDHDTLLETPSMVYVDVTSNQFCFFIIVGSCAASTSKCEAVLDRPVFCILVCGSFVLNCCV